MSTAPWALHETEVAPVCVPVARIVNVSGPTLPKPLACSGMDLDVAAGFKASNPPAFLLHLPDQLQLWHQHRGQRSGDLHTTAYLVTLPDAPTPVEPEDVQDCVWQAVSQGADSYEACGRPAALLAQAGGVGEHPWRHGQEGHIVVQQLWQSVSYEVCICLLPAY